MGLFSRLWWFLRDGPFFGGSGMRAVAITPALERAPGRPVLTSKEVCVGTRNGWPGCPEKISGYGRLFES